MFVLCYIDGAAASTVSLPRAGGERGLAVHVLLCAGEPDKELACVLGKHAGKLQWVASIFQPKMTQAATLLPVLLDANGQGNPAHPDAGSLHCHTRAMLCREPAGDAFGLH